MNILALFIAVTTEANNTSYVDFATQVVTNTARMENKYCNTLLRKKSLIRSHVNHSLYLKGAI